MPLIVIVLQQGVSSPKVVTPFSKTQHLLKLLVEALPSSRQAKEQSSPFACSKGDVLNVSWVLPLAQIDHNFFHACDGERSPSGCKSSPLGSRFFVFIVTISPKSISIEICSNAETYDRKKKFSSAA